MYSSTERYYNIILFKYACLLLINHRTLREEWPLIWRFYNRWSGVILTRQIWMASKRLFSYFCSLLIFIVGFVDERVLFSSKVFNDKEVENIFTRKSPYPSTKLRLWIGKFGWNPYYKYTSVLIQFRTIFYPEHTYYV